MIKWCCIQIVYTHTCIHIHICMCIYRFLASKQSPVVLPMLRRMAFLPSIPMHQNPNLVKL